MNNISNWLDSHKATKTTLCVAAGFIIADITISTLYELYKKIEEKKQECENKKKNKITIPIIHNPRKKSLFDSLFNTNEDCINDETVRTVKSKLSETENKNLEFIIHTDGGDMCSIKQICDSVIMYKRNNPSAKLTIIVPYKAFSAGTMLLLLADELIFSNYTHLSPFDIQVNKYFTPQDYEKLMVLKQEKCKDASVLYNQVCKRAQDTFNAMLDKYIKYSPKFDTDEKRDKIKKLSKGDMLHSHLLSIDELDEYGIAPDKILDTVELLTLKKKYFNNHNVA